MWNILAGRVIYPLHERLLGRSTFRYWRELEASQWSSPADLLALQRAKLAELLEHCWKLPFYRARFCEAGVDPRDGDPVAVLNALPPLHKSDVRRGIQDMLWRGAPGPLVESNTGGSTGEPLIFYLDRRRQAYDQAARMRTHRWFGVEPGDRELYLWGSPVEQGRTGRLKRVRDRLFNHRLLDAFEMSTSRMDAYLEAWDRFGPACLFGYPSSIVRFVEHARTRGRALNVRGLKAVFVTGEVCCAEDRTRIAEYFGVPVADGYGSRDAGFIAHECPARRMHLTAENVIVEVFAGDRALPVGQTGELVVTHLDAYGMPLVRYRTGDVGSLLAGRCACGRGLPMMDVVAGRSTDFLCLPDGTVRHALAIIYPLRATPGIRQFRVVQSENYDVCVEVVCDDAVARVTREAVAQRVRPVVGGEVGLEIRMVRHIEPNAAGKHRYVVSHVRPAAACTKGGRP